MLYEWRTGRESRTLGFRLTNRYERDHAHLSDFDLERYCRGIFLRSGETRKIERHLTGCAVCRDRLEECGRYVRALQIMLGTDAPGRGHQVRHRRLHDEGPGIDRWWRLAFTRLSSFWPRGDFGVDERGGECRDQAE